MATHFVPVIVATSGPALDDSTLPTASQAVADTQLALRRLPLEPPAGSGTTASDHDPSAKVSASRSLPELPTATHPPAVQHETPETMVWAAVAPEGSGRVPVVQCTPSVEVATPSPLTRTHMLP